jgi:hypothetical protein
VVSVTRNRVVDESLAEVVEFDPGRARSVGQER